MAGCPKDLKDWRKVSKPDTGMPVCMHPCILYHLAKLCLPMDSITGLDHIHLLVAVLGL